MMARYKVELQKKILQHIAEWRGTVHGVMIKNMYERGASIESICEAAHIDISEYEEDGEDE